MKTETIISGFGGQGVMLAGTLLCYAGLKEDKSVTFFPSYGAEIRGGTANCQVIISDNPIGSPVVSIPDILVSFNKQSYDRFSPKVKFAGTIIANTSIFDPQTPEKINLIGIPANNIAEKCGASVFMNMVMIGALIKTTGILQLESAINSIPEVLSHKKKDLWEANGQAIKAGYNYP